MTWTLLFRIVIGILLIISGGSKLFDLKGFRRIVAFYGILPAWLLSSAYIMPFLELGAGVALLFTPFTFYASLVAEILLVNAVLFLIIGLLKKKKMENCGCFGTYIKIPLSWWEVAEDFVWIALNTVVLFSSL